LQSQQANYTAVGVKPTTQHSENKYEHKEKSHALRKSLTAGDKQN
jgi:hypothetical protein